MTVCQEPVVAVGAVFSVQSDGSFHGRWNARIAKVADDIGRFDDESR